MAKSVPVFSKIKIKIEVAEGDAPAQQFKVALLDNGAHRVVNPGLGDLATFHGLPGGETQAIVTADGRQWAQQTVTIPTSGDASFTIKAESIPGCGEKCSGCLPDQAKWTHAEKLRLAGEAAKIRKSAGNAPGDPPNNANYFSKTVQVFNAVAQNLKLNALWIHALCGAESGWLDKENDWLKNPYGLTMAGHDNLGFNSLEQASGYWICLYGAKLRGKTTLKEFIDTIRDLYKTVKPEYQSESGFSPYINTVQKRLAKNLYKTKALADGTVILEPITKP